MTGSSRRNFLIASGAGAAAVGVAAAVPGMASAQTPAAEKPLTTPAGAPALAAHISDPSSGTLSIFVGDHEVVVHDPDLVARISRAAQSNPKAV